MSNIEDFILTEDETDLYISKLYSSLTEVKRYKKQERYYVPEPRWFKVLFNELNNLGVDLSKPILELNRNSDMLEQVCNELGYNYSGAIHNPDHSKNKEDRNVCNWSGSIISNFCSLHRTTDTIYQALHRLMPGTYFAISHDCSVLTTLKRYRAIYKDFPPNYMLIPQRNVWISNEGKFGKEHRTEGYPMDVYWFIWLADDLGKKKDTIARWIENEMYEDYYKPVHNPEDPQNYGDVITNGRIFREGLEPIANLDLGK